MKIGKLILAAATCAVVFSSCTQKETLSYICRCTGNAMGPVETYRIEQTSDDDAKEQCESYAKMPTADSTVCVLEIY